MIVNQSERGLQYFTLSEIEPRVWLMLTGCNFQCKGCFRPARDVKVTLLTCGCDSRENGEEFREKIMDQGNINIKRSFNVYLNGMNIKNLEGIKTEVKGNAEIIILSWVSGG